jgi:hypothetical protein
VKRYDGFYWKYVETLAAGRKYVETLAAGRKWLKIISEARLSYQQS